jgi:hypothetical protein
MRHQHEIFPAMATLYSFHHSYILLIHRGEVFLHKEHRVAVCLR